MKPITTPVRHVVSALDFADVDFLTELFARAKRFEESDRAGTLPQALKGKIVATLFYEPSTRTRFSFEAAVQKLGGGLITAENAAGHSSAVKGETIEDTIRVVAGYADAIVMRHFEQGAAKRAAAVSPVPVINAGDGAGEHPTQAFLDVYTIHKELGGVNGRTIALVGDLRYGRTIHSLLPLLALYKGMKINLAAPRGLELPEEQRAFLDSRKIAVHECGRIDDAIADADVVYVTRIQKERFNNAADYEAVKGSYVFDAAALKKLKSGAIIMHPLPRVNEISGDVDRDPRAAYFRQARNGLYVRMALLDFVFSPGAD